MKSLIFVLLTFCVATVFAKSATTDNPLLQEFKTPFGVPPFDKIKPEHFLPAIKEAVNNQQKIIKGIIENKAKPDFKNTVLALEESSEKLNLIAGIFYNLLSANTNQALQDAAKEIAPLMSRNSDEILLNADLFKKIDAVYKEKSKLKGEDLRLLEVTYLQFTRGGAGLDPQKKEKVKELNEKLSLLSLKFGDNLLAETNAFKLILEDKNDLAGLPQFVIDAAAETAKKSGNAGKWVFTLHNPSIMPFLQYSSRRDLRERIWRAWSNRGNNANDKNNNETVKELSNLRLEKAKIFGYDNYANYSLVDAMAKNSDNVYKLLDQLWKPAIDVAKNEASEFQKMIDKEGGNFKLQAWDWRYYQEKVRKEKYSLDEEETKPYFVLENVRKGIFYVANKLYGLSFKEIKDIPKYHPEATAFEVLDAKNKLLAILYLDFFPRESKRGGAWMTNYREEYIKNGKRVAPVISLVGNFSKPTGDVPALLTADEAETFFHEFGHGLHGMLTQCKYRSLSGTNVPRDFVEVLSQFNENWAFQPEVLKVYATHYKTGEVIPAALVEKMKKSGNFGQGFATVEYLAASYLDMAFHSITKDLSEDPQKFEENFLTKLGLIPEIISRYKTTYFNHIWGGGYSAGYYSYIWSEVFDQDAFSVFKKNGIFDKKTADSFRTNVLERGYTDEPMNLYKKFRGQEPSIEPLLEKRGLK